MRFNTKQAAEYFSKNGIPFSQGTLEVWRCQGRGPKYRKLNSRVFYLKKDLDAFLESALSVETVDSIQNN